MTRSRLVTAGQLLMSSHPELQAAGAGRVRGALWFEANAQQALDLHLDELLLALVRPDAPEAVLREALASLEALAGFAAGESALRAARLPAHVDAALAGGWLPPALVGRARGLSDALAGRGGGAWRAAARAEGAPAPAAAGGR